MKVIKWATLLLFFNICSVQSKKHLSSKEYLMCSPALVLAQQGDFLKAQDYIKGRDCPVTQEILTWLSLKNGLNSMSFQEIVAFMQTHSDWPCQEMLIRRAENSITHQTSPSHLLKWFQEHSPQTLKGLFSYMNILSPQDEEQASKAIRKFWIEKDLSSQEEKEILKKLKAYIHPADIKDRAIALLNKKKLEQAERLIPYVSGKIKSYIEVRLALQKKEEKADFLLKKNKMTGLEDPDLAKDYVTWLRNKNDSRLEEFFKQIHQLYPQYPEKFWTERHIIARDALEKSRYAESYTLISQHNLKEGSEYVEAEWFSGWIALRYLKDPHKALKHFMPLKTRVKTSISQARVLYWIGRAYEELQEQSKAQEYYQQAAQLIHTFYGQQAFKKLDKKHKQILPKSLILEKEHLYTQEEKGFISIMKILAKSGLREEAFLFAQLAAKNCNSSAQCQHVLLLTHELMPSYAVTIAHQIAKQHPTYYQEAYPVLQSNHIRRLPSDIDPALAHALIRQESAFNPQIVSGAGAHGLMQVMPETAQDLALSRKLKYKGKHSLFDPLLNIELGSVYLKEQLKNHNHSFILTLAAYNAGPGIVRKWLERFKDPRDSSIDHIDWIESLPYGETRSYIQRVLENYYVYKIILGEKRGSTSEKKRKK